MSPSARQILHPLSPASFAPAGMNKWIALALVLILPGGIFLPICYRFYAAIRLRTPGERAPD